MPQPRSLKAIYRSLRPFITQIETATLKHDDFYAIALKAALIKSYDFNSYISTVKNTAHAFYLTATLRGLCEDIIFLKAVSGFSPKDRNDLIMHTMFANTFEGLWRQTDFFLKNRPEQPVLGIKDAERKVRAEENAALQVFAKYNLVRGGRKPTIRQLARGCGLLPLYDYMYSVTSKLVHFSPQILLRMGWSPDNSKDATFTFSAKNFNRYYAEFNAVYGAYLFALFHDNLGNNIKLPTGFSEFVEQLRFNLDEAWRWPESVTYEEMNQRPPSPILIGALKVLKDEGKLPRR